MVYGLWFSFMRFTILGSHCMFRNHKTLFKLNYISDWKVSHISKKDFGLYLLWNDYITQPVHTLAWLGRCHADQGEGNEVDHFGGRHFDSVDGHLTRFPCLSPIYRRIMFTHGYTCIGMLSVTSSRFRKLIRPRRKSPSSVTTKHNLATWLHKVFAFMKWLHPAATNSALQWSAGRWVMQRRSPGLIL